MEITKKSKGKFASPDTKLTAALITLGAHGPEGSDAPPEVERRYSDKHPYKGDNSPGQVWYYLEPESPMGVCNDLMQAYYQDFSPSQEEEAEFTAQLDDLIEQLTAIARSTDGSKPLRTVVNRLKTILPLAIMKYLRTGFENRERLLDMWRKGRQVFVFRTGPRSFILRDKKSAMKLMAGDRND